MKLFLIGYMGSGKSTVGKFLAQKLSSDFIDFDDYIEKKQGKTISEIFQTEGEKKFRELENESLKKLLVKKNTVISLGGGTPCFHNNMELINQNGTSVYIEMSVDALAKRLIKARKKRPLIEGMNEMDLRFFIAANLEKRLPFYLQAHHRIKSENQTAEQLAEKIAKEIFPKK